MGRLKFHCSRLSANRGLLQGPTYSSRPTTEYYRASFQRSSVQSGEEKPPSSGQGTLQVHIERQNMQVQSQSGDGHWAKPPQGGQFVIARAYTATAASTHRGHFAILNQSRMLTHDRKDMGRTSVPASFRMCPVPETFVPEGDSWLWPTLPRIETQSSSCSVRVVPLPNQYSVGVQSNCFLRAKINGVRIRDVFNSLQGAYSP